MPKSFPNAFWEVEPMSKVDYAIRGNDIPSFSMVSYKEMWIFEVSLLISLSKKLFGAENWTFYRKYSFYKVSLKVLIAWLRDGIYLRLFECIYLENRIL